MMIQNHVRTNQYYIDGTECPRNKKRIYETRKHQVLWKKKALNLNHFFHCKYTGKKKLSARQQSKALCAHEKKIVQKKKH